MEKQKSLDVSCDIKKKFNKFCYMFWSNSKDNEIMKDISHNLFVISLDKIYYYMLLKH